MSVTYYNGFSVYLTSRRQVISFAVGEQTLHNIDRLFLMHRDVLARFRMAEFEMSVIGNSSQQKEAEKEETSSDNSPERNALISSVLVGMRAIITRLDIIGKSPRHDDDKLEFIIMNLKLQKMRRYLEEQKFDTVLEESKEFLMMNDFERAKTFFNKEFPKCDSSEQFFSESARKAIPEELRAKLAKLEDDYNEKRRLILNYSISTIEESCHEYARALAIKRERDKLVSEFKKEYPAIAKERFKRVMHDPVVLDNARERISKIRQLLAWNISRNSKVWENIDSILKTGKVDDPDDVEEFPDGEFMEKWGLTMENFNLLQIHSDNGLKLMSGVVRVPVSEFSLMDFSEPVDIGSINYVKVGFQFSSNGNYSVTVDDENSVAVVSREFDEEMFEQNFNKRFYRKFEKCQSGKIEHAEKRQKID